MVASLYESTKLVPIALGLVMVAAGFAMWRWGEHMIDSFNYVNARGRMQYPPGFHRLAAALFIAFGLVAILGGAVLVK